MRRRSYWILLATIAIVIAGVLVLYGSPGGLLWEWLAELHGRRQ